jgi:hypothetical protein
MCKTTIRQLLWSLLTASALGCGGAPGDIPDAATAGDPTLSGLPSCPAGTVTADMLYPVVQRSCALPSCHDAKGFPYAIASAADLKPMLLAAAVETQVMPRVTPGQLDKSYLMYKLMGQQKKAAPAGTAGQSMPLGGSMLGTDDLCQFISWIQGGAH